ncbi:MAG: lasso peptide biosynthesis B2 protein [Alphaproteobacteria bacterium]|nr:lasso peptide biosynthesis B2 protein [Alphaproteobacteria bacterium]
MRGFDARDTRFVVRASALAIALPPLLRALPLPELVRRVAGDLGASAALPEPSRMVWLTDGVLRRGRGPFAANCVVRSLILLRYLRRRGVPAVVVFGARRTAEKPIDGHAWVTIDGEPLAEATDPRPLYRETYRFPEGA